MDITIDPASLRHKLQAVVGERNPFTAPAHLARVESYIEREFARYGLAVESDWFSYRGENFRNVIGKLERRRDAPLFIVGAHFDAVPGTPGADDNGSGVAVLLETARIVARARVRSNVFFCAFNLEELNMIGSAHYAKKLKAAGARLQGMISLEMLGYADARPGTQRYPFSLKWFYPDRGDFIGVIGNWSSKALLEQFARQMRGARGLPVETLSLPGTGGLIPEVRLSDHSPFWDEGFPALMITDTAFLRNPHYHRPTDTIETLDLDFMSKVCEGVIRGVLSF
ncbi:MAG TPA: M28 family peptidase [Candidatus Eisenbacteria bacterium]|nr:M28 family peptidase [Candidatus Eisenbacteria bacterium]